MCIRDRLGVDEERLLADEVCELRGRPHPFPAPGDAELLQGGGVEAYLLQRLPQRLGVLVDRQPQYGDQHLAPGLDPHAGVDGPSS
eukprot:9805398-Lingulodinium_polyedra.AAC.1